MHLLKKVLSPAGVYVKSFLKWLLIAGITGGIGGLVGVLFRLSIHHAAHLRQAHNWILYLLPLGGLVIVLFYKLFRLEGKGTNNILEAAQSGEKIPPLLIPAIFLGTVITHLCGGSAGREGAALQLGGGIGSLVGRVVRLDNKDLRLATMCGMSAVFSALFGTPLTAALFALEVVSVGVFYYSGLFPCLVSSLTAYGISLLFGLAPTAFVIDCIPLFSLADMLRVAGLAALCAMISILFCLAMHNTEHLLERLFKSPWLRVLVGGVLIVLLTLLVGTTDYNGAGEEIIASAMAGSARPWDFLLKILFTAITIGCGFKGGEVVPTFFIGATFGCAAGPLLGLDAGFSAAVGLAATFCGVVNCPIASILLSIELFGAQGLVFYAAACSVSYLLSGYYGLYSSQQIVYSKLRPEYINIRAK